MSLGDHTSGKVTGASFHLGTQEGNDKSRIIGRAEAVALSTARLPLAFTIAIALFVYTCAMG
jgi:hypothetical protein